MTSTATAVDCLEGVDIVSHHKQAHGPFLLCLAILAVAAPARADVFQLSYLPARIEELPLPFFGRGTVVGVESFNRLRSTGQGNAPSFMTDFDSQGAITGRYSGVFGILPADQYGGAANRGNYIATFDSGGYTIDLGHDASLPGINYFGMALSALDAGNSLDFLRNGQVVYTYDPATLIAALGPCSNGNQYCGNPTTGQDSNEQFAFVSLQDQSGYFDQVRFRELNGGGGYESDNHSVGYRPVGTTVSGTAVPVPEPDSWVAIGMGLLGLGVYRFFKTGAPSRKR